MELQHPFFGQSDVCLQIFRPVCEMMSKSATDAVAIDTKEATANKKNAHDGEMSNRSKRA